jgi:hypothetical protein
MTLDPLWLALPALLTLVYVGTLVQYPLDFWYHVTTGRATAASGTVVDRDNFTHTIAGQPVTNQDWAAQVATYALYRAGGFPLVQFAAGLLYAAAMAVTTAGAWCRARDPRIAAGMALGALALALSNFGIRPQAISLLLFAVELLVLWQCGDRWWSVVAVLLVEILWSNTHGAFPLGIVLPGLFSTAAACSAWRDGGWHALATARGLRCYAIATLLAMVAAFCNPHPGQTLDYVFGVTSRATQRGIGEWMPVSWGSPSGIVLLLSLLAAVAIVAMRRKSMETIELLLLVVFGVGAVAVQRMMVWWGMAMALALAPHVAALLAAWSGSRVLSPEESRAVRASAASPVSFGMLLVLAAAVAMSTPWTRAYNPLLPPAKRQAHADDDPHAVVEFLRQSGYRGRAFNPLEWGGCLTWFCDPGIKVFIDGRVDFFPDRVWNDYATIGNAGRGWDELLRQYGVELVVWNRQLSEKLPTALARSSRWKNVYQDHLATVYVLAR